MGRVKKSIVWEFFFGDLKYQEFKIVTASEKVLRP